MFLINICLSVCGILLIENKSEITKPNTKLTILQREPSIFAGGKPSIVCAGNGTSRTLTCSGTSKVKVLSALYGRTDGSVCPVGSVGKTTCYQDMTDYWQKRLVYFKRNN